MVVLGGLWWSWGALPPPSSGEEIAPSTRDRCPVELLRRALHSAGAGGAFRRDPEALSCGDDELPLTTREAGPLAPVDEANLPERAEALFVLTPATTRGAIADQGLNRAASPRFLKIDLRKKGIGAIESILQRESNRDQELTFASGGMFVFECLENGQLN